MGRLARALAELSAAALLAATAGSGLAAQADVKKPPPPPPQTPCWTVTPENPECSRFGSRRPTAPWFRPTGTEPTNTSRFCQEP